MAVEPLPNNEEYERRVDAAEKLSNAFKRIVLGRLLRSALTTENEGSSSVTYRFCFSAASWAIAASSLRIFASMASVRPWSIQVIDAS
jgi:hypothetical protein